MIRRGDVYCLWYGSARAAQGIVGRLETERILLVTHLIRFRTVLLRLQTIREAR